MRFCHSAKAYGLFLCIWLVMPCFVVAADAWPQFRGPNADGVVTDANDLPTEWTASENVAWKTDIPGRGWSSPIVWENRVFLTTVINHGDGEEPKKGLYFGGNRPELPASEHEWVVICLDLNSGDVLWKKQVRKASPKTSIHLKNSYASETPVTDGEHVYAMFGGVGVYCFDMDGNEVWMHNLEPRKTRYGWGTAASPVLFGDRLYVVNDNDEDSYLMALDKRTGEQIWRTPREEKSNWSTPYIWENELRREIVTLGSGKVRSYDLDGNLLWSLTGMSSITIATPYQHNGLLYISSGYVGDSDRPLYAIRPGAEGDISLEGTETANESIVWSQPTGAPYNPTTIAYEGVVYVLYDRGLFAAYDAADGSEIYSKVRIPNGGEFTSSPWAYGGKIFCINEDGVTSVIKAGTEFELLGSNPLAEDDMAMATPAIAGDRLLIRTATRIYCIQK
ncbi:serine/threonine protein kinase related protein-like protein [Rhodopirellula maiorica SM1]|uniref:Serine/threonine protein kinase related protein-like protein n=2 Tax=Novipirellula TaxID=2795426 RepID=M5S4W5_9BACT|nr:serine/threonine protein kinase related protein-like protein [Rhodopirellula maiorica SM1]